MNSTESLLAKHFAVGYEKSSNRKLYDYIGFNYGVSPRIVYMIAHGRNPSDRTQKKIQDDLYNAGILRFNGYVGSTFRRDRLFGSKAI